MEGFSCVTLIYFARGHTVPFNSCVLALQLVLICIAAEVSVLSEVIPVKVARIGLFINSKSKQCLTLNGCVTCLTVHTRAC